MPRNQLLRKIKTDIERYGVSIIGVGSDDKIPSFAYSIGLFKTFQHPEIIVFGLPFETASLLINGITVQLAEGKRYTTGFPYVDIANYTLQFLSVPKEKYEGFVNLCLWFYSGADFPVLQLVWPDPAGKFPWDEGFDEGFRKAQLMIGSFTSLMKEQTNKGAD